MLPESEFLNVLEWITDHYKNFETFPIEYEGKNGIVYDISYIQDSFYNVNKVLTGE